MAKHPTRVAKNEHQREFIKLFDSMCGKHSRYEVWADFVLLTAIEISNIVDVAHRGDRYNTYVTVSAKYTEAEREPFAAMLGHIILGIEEDPDQDFLGELYMNLDLGNDHAGQFFTPYDVCKMMAIITSSDIKAQVEKKGWIGVNDPACGAGATLIAFANYCLEQGVNYQQHCLFVAQDIDYTVACMCYIQLSLMGCPGYVRVGNTLTNPGTSYDGRGLLPVDDGNVWYDSSYLQKAEVGKGFIGGNTMKPILFNTEMVRAILEGRKTCTRRVIKPQPKSQVVYCNRVWQESMPTENGIRILSPPYAPGEILYVRETWKPVSAMVDYWDFGCPSPIGDGVGYQYKADGCIRWLDEFEPMNDEFHSTEIIDPNKWCPSIHMPKDAARIFLMVKDVRVERLQDISEGEAKKEGFVNDICLVRGCGKSAARHFADFFNATIKSDDRDKYGWNSNPWVWVISFERCKNPKEAQQWQLLGSPT